MKKLLGFLSVLFYVNIAFAYVTENVTGGCAEPPNGILRAVFTLNEHTCASGYYLPANYDGCVPCPKNATCAGGTFTFNEHVAHGITYAIPITANISRGCSLNLSGIKIARFVPNEYDCNFGEYLPANTDGCVVCPVNSYCTGGTYTFNETVPQGIVACATGLQSPMGMWESDQCGRVLHIDNDVIYLRATKKTTHAVHFDFNNDNVADYFANMTTVDVPMHAGTTRKLKVQFDGQTYSVYDDTVTVPE